MRIRRALAFPYRPAAGQCRPDCVIIRVDTDDGLTGWGEAYGADGMAALTCRAFDTLIAPRCIGQEVGEDIGLAQTIGAILHALGGSGPVAFALAGLDVALWDLAGKRRGQPVHALLGAKRAVTLASAVRLDYASLAAGSEPPWTQATLAGHAGLYLAGATLSQLQAARRAFPGAALMLQPPRPWRADAFMTRAAALRELALAWVEDPLWPLGDHTAQAALRARAGLRLAGGQLCLSRADAWRQMDAGAIDVLQISPTRLGGLSAAIGLAQHARSAGVDIAPLALGEGPGYLACLHLATALAPEALVCVHAPGASPALCGPAAAPGGNGARAPETPGLGADPDPDLLEAGQQRFHEAVA